MNLPTAPPSSPICSDPVLLPKFTKSISPDTSKPRAIKKKFNNKNKILNKLINVKLKNHIENKTLIDKIKLLDI